MNSMKAYDSGGKLLFGLDGMSLKMNNFYEDSFSSKLMDAFESGGYDAMATLMFGKITQVKVASASDVWGGNSGSVGEPGAGNDTLTGEGGGKLAGGKGDDTYVVDLIKKGGKPALADSVAENAGEGNDTLKLNAPDLQLTSPFTLVVPKNFEAVDLSGTGSNKLNLTGNALDNLLTGNSADNVITGLAGNDTLIGGQGNDTLVGGLGNDSLTGGLGADRFVFDSALNDKTNLDVITDFASGVDKLVLSDKIFTKLKGDTNLGDNFVPGQTLLALDANDYLYFDIQTSTLYYDADASGSKGAIAICKLVGVTTLSASDMVIASGMK